MKTIVVGLDTSERAGAVLRTALRLAEAFGGKIIAVRATAIPIEFPAEALSIAPDALPARLQSITQKSLERAVANVPPELLLRAEARIGSPWQVLCDIAKEDNAELIVVGTHGFGALDHVIGTNAARVVNHARCSVIVVRNESFR